MKNKSTFLCTLLLITGIIVFSSCRKQSGEGKLFIIGGGHISPEMIDKMILESKINEEGYGIILPMSSVEPDSAVIEHLPGFIERGCTTMYGLNFKKGEAFSQAKIDSICNARLVFISGGDQSIFMNIIAGTPIKEAIHEVYSKGGVIAGTSAGASLMSKKMVTGNQKKHPEIDGDFYSMESDNVEMIEGLGFLEHIIIDQHFIVRKRLNRLVSMCIENPDLTGVGIDESTAIYVDGNTAMVYGTCQVLVIDNPSSEIKEENGLLGARNLKMNIYLPGEKFKIKR